MVAAALVAARDLLVAAILLAALLLAVRVAIFGDLGSALGAIGVWGFAMAFALSAPPVRPEAPRLRAVAPLPPGDEG